MVKAMAFNQARINNLKPRDKRYTLADDNLLIMVEPSGSISFYAYIDRKQIHLGKHPDLTIRQAVKLKNTSVNQHYMGTLEVTKETFAEFVRGKDFTDWSKGTRRTHDARMAAMESTILPAIGKVKLAKFGKGDLTKYKNARLAVGVLETTINRELTDISAVLTQARELGVIHHSVKVDKYREDRTKEIYQLTDGEIQALRKAATRKEGTAWNQYRRKHLGPIIDIALYCGLRTGEILSLQWGDIVHSGHFQEKLAETVAADGGSSEEGKAFIEAERSDYAFSVRGPTTKTKQSRLVPIGKELTKTLLHYYLFFVAMPNTEWREKMVERYKDGRAVDLLQGLVDMGSDHLAVLTLEDAILPEDKNRRIFPFGKINEGIKTVVKKAGLPKVVTLRTMRHHFCTHCLDAGMTLKDVKDFAGHASITTTERYLHSNPKRKFETYQLYEARITKQMGLTG